MLQTGTSPQRSRHYVAPCDFEIRLTSRSRLVRADDREEDAIGLLDVETGDHFLVRRAEWLKYNAGPRQILIPV